MKDAIRPIGVLLSRETECALAEQVVRGMGHKPVVPIGDGFPFEHIRTASLLIADESAMKRWGAELKLLRRHNDSPLPTLLGVLDPDSDSDFWLNEGMDDVLVKPLNRLRLESKIRLFCRLPEQTEGPACSGGSVFRAMMEQSLIGVGCTLEDRILYLNNAGANILGLGADENTGTFSPEDFFHPVDLEEGKGFVRACLATPGVCPNQVLRIMRRDGELRFIEATGKSFDFQEKKSVLYFFVDITEEKRLQQSLERKAKDLDSRVRELDCVFSLSKLLEPSDTPLERILQGTIDLIPSALPYPDRTFARLSYAGMGFYTDPFRETELKRKSMIPVKGLPAADLEIFSSLPSMEPEESNGNVDRFLDSITERLGKVIERKQQDENVRESEERLRRAIMHAPIPVLLYREDGRVLMVNEVLTELTGYRQEDIPTIDEWTRKGFRDMKDQVKKFISDLYTREGRTLGNERTIYTATGEKRTWTFSSAPLGKQPDGKKVVITMAMDVTDRNRVQAERERLAAIVEQAGEGILVLDPDGVVRYANPAFLRFTGKSGEALSGEPLLNVFGGGFGGTDFTEITETLNRGLNWNGRMTFRGEEGKEIIAEVMAFPLANGRNIEGHSLMFRDITQELHMERQLRQVQKLEAIGTLAGGIAHDFNNMLTAILGYSELMLEEAPEDSPFRDEINEVLRAGQRARELVRQILSFSRQEEQIKEPVQISSIVKETCKFLHASLPSTIQIRPAVFRDSDMVLADPSQLHQMIMNLCTNAAHAMTEKGGILEIGLDAKEIGLEESASFLDVYPGSYLRLTVKDTGCGISPSIIERIFDPFFSTKTQGEGTGLGLSIVHGIVKNHGGHISVSSELEKGTLFEILLPRIEPAPTCESGEAKRMSGGKERIMVVDDEEMLAAMTQRMLQRLGYQVESHTRSREALKAFTADPHRYHLIITDKTMPELTGENMAREMVSLRPDIPIILCTGYNDLPADNLADRGIRVVLKKPLEMKELVGTIREILDGAAV